MPYFKTENGNAENIKYDNTKSVKEAIDDIKDTAMFIDSFDTDTGTLNTTSVSSSSSSNPTAASVTFDNTDTGLAAANVQDAVTEVNGNLSELTNDMNLTARTDAGGDIDLPVFGTGKKIIYAYNNANLFVIPRFIIARNCWGVKVLDANWIPVANTEVTIYYAVGESKS